MRTLILLATSSLPLFALVLASPGCQQQPVNRGSIVEMPTQPQSNAPVNQGRIAAPQQAVRGDPIDPCSMRMQDLVTPLILYYSLNKRLPDNLQDLHSVAGIDADLNFTCPTSGKPYIYNPTGLQAQAGDTSHLILYDAVPAHNGNRWGVVATPTPNRYGQVFFQMDVVLLTPKVFSSFKPVPPPLALPAVAIPSDGQAPGDAPPANVPPANGSPAGVPPEAAPGAEVPTGR